MYTIEEIKKRIAYLHKNAPDIHMDVSLNRPKLVLRDAEATIIGVYPHIFQIREVSTGAEKSHTLQYSDIVTGSIVIKELDGVAGK